jgi:peptide/nickel transport system ATP-binding protein
MATDAHSPSHADFLLRVRGLSKTYWLRRRAFLRRAPLAAARDVSFDVVAGKTLALVGSSGSGKSTVARCVARLERPDAGEIWIDSRDIASLGQHDLFPVRTDVQMVFQDPATSMNPRMSAAEVIAEPLVLQKRGTSQERRARVAQLMKEVVVAPEWMERRVTEFSGGQRQRIAIARALALRPKLLILDEAFSGLDISTHAQIANLLLDLQAAHSLTYLLISHDLTLVSRMADAVAVMNAGQIVERGPVAQIMTNPTQPETRALVEASESFRMAFAGARQSL